MSEFPGVSPTRVRALRLDSLSAWIEGVRRTPSPNQDARPGESDIEMLVLHGISLPPGSFGTPYVEALFRNELDPRLHPFFAEIASLRVSAHVLIRRDGELVQFVPFNRRAWHAGVSGYRGRDRCNDFSIGVELEGTDIVPYEEVQYAQLVNLIRVLRARWPAITRSNIVGHCDIAPGRKTDPGPSFDWRLLWAMLAMDTRN